MISESNHSLVEACLKMLQKEFTWNKAVFPDLNHITVIDGIAQLSQGHVKLVHSNQKTHTHKNP